MAKRFQTYFDIPIPPKKRKKIGAGSTTIRFVLTGKIPSKKNNQQAVTIRKYAREWANSQKEIRSATWDEVHKAISICTSQMRGNSKYVSFLEKVKPLLQEQMLIWSNRLSEKGLIFPLPPASFNLSLYWKDRYIRDSANALQTIQDALVDSGILSNDDYTKLNPIYVESDNFYDEIIHNIAFISLTIKL